ncbi:hypothetical protein F2Q65_02410 [Thiohalocapsa marina]|uniref:GH26 domain-containing protein n=1 Tax=Thiohalocapsa marina TaxID=424902 RepID=A0A5M8FUB5_9GAMM|nr:hypothetical protein [Thiohalocapsa marina]KAA6187394.1 hypothetical protein F2Q65_02410 [Thiohalocapsa marina]
MSNPLVRITLKALAGLALVLPVMVVVAYGTPGVQSLLWRAQAVLAPTVSRLKHPSTNYGVYDPLTGPDGEQAFGDAQGVAIEHVFLSWLDPERTSHGASLDAMHQYARDRGRWLMVTIEPSSDGRQVAEGGFLQQVLAGAYDENIDTTCRMLGRLESPLLVRWGHEMESRQARYPWSGQPADDYIAAYRGFVDACRRQIAEGYYIWSPMGNSGLADYWPGTRYADYVAVTIFGDARLDMQVERRRRSFVKLFQPLYQWISIFDRPIMIAELGVQGSPAYQQLWMRDLFQNLDQFPLLKTIVYFNATDVVKWPDETVIRDWRIPGDIFE